MLSPHPTLSVSQASVPIYSLRSSLALFMVCPLITCFRLCRTLSTTRRTHSYWFFTVQRRDSWKHYHYMCLSIWLIIWMTLLPLVSYLIFHADCLHGNTLRLSTSIVLVLAKSNGHTVFGDWTTLRSSYNLDIFLRYEIYCLSINRLYKL